MSSRRQKMNGFPPTLEYLHLITAPVCLIGLRMIHGDDLFWAMWGTYDVDGSVLTSISVLALSKGTMRLATSSAQRPPFQAAALAHASLWENVRPTQSAVDGTRASNV